MKGLFKKKTKEVRATDDSSIIQLYIDRSEQAIAETGVKYGAYCFSIAKNILANDEDSEECVNDAYLAAWNAIPPHLPGRLSTFLGKLTRNLAINCWKSRNASKRIGGEWAVALEELQDIADERQDLDGAISYRETIASFNRFLETLPKTDRDVFLRRYWFADPISDIAESFGFSQSKVTSMLFRTRQKLYKHFEKENIV